MLHQNLFLWVVTVLFRKNDFVFQSIKDISLKLFYKFFKIFDEKVEALFWLHVTNCIYSVKFGKN